MTRFILVRHGQTAWNQPERFRGREDLPLSDLGHRQVEAVARRIAADWPEVAMVYTSPLQRTWQTAEAIARALGLTSQPLAGLLDLDYGAWQGLSHQEAAARYGEMYVAWRLAPHTVQFPACGRASGQRCGNWPTGTPGRRWCWWGIRWSTKCCCVPCWGWTMPTSGRSSRRPAA